ncbi:MAG: hypothetical protein WAN50_02515 [Minisyncoccia bacterium]
MSDYRGDDTSFLERAKQRLYKQTAVTGERKPLAAADDRSLPHEWNDAETDAILRRAARRAARRGARHVRWAAVFFSVAVVFFLGALGVAGYFFYFGGNTVSVDKISMDIQGPTTIAGGDIVPLSVTVTNKNPVAVSNATIEIDFPNGTRDATNVLQPYSNYIENLGTIPSGGTVTRSVKAIVFGSSGQTVSLPVSFSYGTAGSNAVFQKNSSYPLTISTTPLSVSVDAPSQTVSGKPLTLTLNVRSNTTVPLTNVILTGDFPFGFSITSSSIPLTSSSFLLGTLNPGSSAKITLTGTLIGQNSEQRVFHFTVGTGKTANDQTLAISYMTQDAPVTITAPFISTTLAINGDTSGSAVLAPNSRQSVTLSYTNTLPTGVTNASVAVTITGSAVDYSSIQASNGFYRSADHTILFSPDTDPALASLAPGASGVGAFSFSTLAAGAATSPTVTFTTSVSGTSIGDANVPSEVNASSVVTAKVLTAVSLSAVSHHTGGTGPIPPQPDKITTYSVEWNVQNSGSPIAGGIVSATLPSYVSFTNVTGGDGTFSYDSTSRTVTWNTGDLAQGASEQGTFQVSLTPSTSQSGTVPELTSPAMFSGYDRFAGVQVSATAGSVTTETTQDPGYVTGNGTVQ